MKIAVAGKGGVGKSTVSAALTEYFAGLNYELYAVDGDPDLSLGTIFGIPSEKLDELKPIVEMRDVIQNTSGGGDLFTLNPNVDDLLNNYTIIHGNIKFLKMGSVKRGGTSCYCRENSVLNALLASLVMERQEMVLLDMGAGIEHLTRGTAGGVDIMLIVTEPTRVSLDTALTIKQLAGDIGVKKFGIIVNKIFEKEDVEYLSSELNPQEIIGEIEYSPELRREGRSRSFEAEIEFIAERILSIVDPEAVEMGGINFA